MTQQESISQIRHGGKFYRPMTWFLQQINAMEKKIHLKRGDYDYTDLKEQPKAVCELHLSSDLSKSAVKRISETFKEI